MTLFILSFSTCSFLFHNFVLFSSFEDNTGKKFIGISMYIDILYCVTLVDMYCVLLWYVNI